MQENFIPLPEKSVQFSGVKVLLHFQLLHETVHVQTICSMKTITTPAACVRILEELLE
jgi:hypothetical protein